VRGGAWGGWGRGRPRPLRFGHAPRVEVGGAYVEELEDACEALGEVAEHGR